MLYCVLIAVLLIFSKRVILKEKMQVIKEKKTKCLLIIGSIFSLLVSMLPTWIGYYQTLNFTPTSVFELFEVADDHRYIATYFFYIVFAVSINFLLFGNQKEDEGKTLSETK